MGKNWRESIPSRWLKAIHLEGKPRLLTITRFTVEKITEDKTGPVVWFAEDKRGLGLNVTNGQSIEKICGSPDPDRWIGQRIVVYPTETDLRGERVDCIRIRAPKAGAKLPPPPPPPVPEEEGVDEDPENDSIAAQYDSDDVPF